MNRDLVYTHPAFKKLDAVVFGISADSVQRQLKESGKRPLHVEGERRSDWVLDYGDFVIHVFTEERRAFYGLDGLWGDAPKLDATALGISEGDPR